MVFYSAFGIRPVRLSEETRRFAYDSLNCKYGKETEPTPAVTMDHVEGFDALSPLEKYNLIIREIAEKAPVRICEGEKISGSASLGDSIRHMVPATKGGRGIFYSVSHLTTDFETVLTKGVTEIRAQAERSLAMYADTEREPFIRSCLSCLDSMEIWRNRYLDALRGREEYRANYEALSRVPFEKPKSFYEAVQSLWFTFAFLRLCGNWPGIGRIDWLLGPYLEEDLASGKLTPEEAREILAHFFIKGCEWIRGGDYGSGDAQHYQNLVIGGRDGEGKDITNAVTYLVLDIIEELGIGDFPTTVRLHSGTPRELLHRVAEVMRYGGGVLAVYNEELIYRSLSEYGYPSEDVWKFANDGCWEVQIPGMTNFGYHPFDGLQILQNRTLKGYGEDVAFDSFEALYTAYLADLRSSVEEIVGFYCGLMRGKDACGNWIWQEDTPCTVVSLFEGGCVESGRSYLEGGAVYNVRSPHFGGLADVVNCLYALQKLIYEDRLCTFSQLMSILRENWEGNEPLRQYAYNRYVYYGNDNDQCDRIAMRLVEDFAAICRDQEGRCGFKTPGGISTFGRQLEWSHARLATPYGRKKGEILAGNASPTPGTDRVGATGVIRSFGKPSLWKMVTGAALDLKLLPSAVKGETGITVLESLLQGFCACGGYFMQLDVADAAILREAQERPEDYATLSVRVSGWNARFVTLNRAWQDMIIAQTENQA